MNILNIKKQTLSPQNKRSTSMKSLKSTCASLTTVVFAAGLALNFAACTSESPLSSQQPHVTTKVVQSNIGTIRLLQVDKNELTLMKGETFKSFKETKKIKAKKGGTIEVGNREYGESRIIFKKNDLPEDITISFEGTAAGTFEGMLNGLEFGPHGLVFNSPVEVQLSYKKADLQGIKEKDLKLFYYNEETELWEFIGGEVDENKKIVIGFLKHFSRYEIGAE